MLEDSHLQARKDQIKSASTLTLNFPASVTRAAHLLLKPPTEVCRCGSAS